MGIFLVLLAGLFASIANFCMRKSIDAGGSSKGYLVVQLAFSFFVMVLLNPVRTENYTWDWQAVGLGLIGGIFFGLLMWGLGKTLEKGPPGLSFAILNSATVIPAIVLVLLFGYAYGHSYSIWNGIGSLLVVAGLFWAGWSAEDNIHKKAWKNYALLMFAAHALFLVYLQWWAMVLRPELPLSSLLPFHIDPTRVAWFMPAVLFVGAIVQLGIYIYKVGKMPKKSEVFWGILGGITNGACTFFLILAPQKATPSENAMLFPIFSVAIIIICNIWAQALYSEKVNWKANFICLAGLLIGSIAWHQFFS